MKLELNTTDTLTQDALKALADEHLAAQDLVQQGAVHALSFLLTQGCSEGVVCSMLASLREKAELIRREYARRGLTPIFEQDQTVFS